MTKRRKVYGPCSRCPALAIRTLGSQAFCAACAEEILAPIRERVAERGQLDRPLAGRGVSTGIREPHDPPGEFDLRCDRCGATWTGKPGDACSYCLIAHQRLIADTRALLLDPPWLHSDAGHQRYDELSEADKAVWDRTRGQTRGADSMRTWAERLARAVDSEIITERQADAAWRRAKERHGRRT